VEVERHADVLTGLRWSRRGVSAAHRPSTAQLRVVTNRDKWLQITPLLPPSTPPPRPAPWMLPRLPARISCLLVMTKSMSILRLRLHLVLSRRLAVIAGEETAPDGVESCGQLTRRRPMNYTLTIQTSGHLSALTYSSRRRSLVTRGTRVFTDMINCYHSCYDAHAESAADFLSSDHVL